MSVACSRGSVRLTHDRRSQPRPLCVLIEYNRSGSTFGALSMFGDGALTFREYVTKEPLPLAIVHRAVLDFLHHRDDAALFGAQAVNAYVDEARMTQEVDILSPRAAELAEEIRKFLNERFKIASRVRKVRQGMGYRIYQIQKSGNRHLV